MTSSINALPSLGVVWMGFFFNAKLDINGQHGLFLWCLPQSILK